MMILRVLVFGLMMFCDGAHAEPATGQKPGTEKYECAADAQDQAGMVEKGRQPTGNEEKKDKSSKDNKDAAGTGK
jgi:hypothetical protein